MRKLVLDFDGTIVSIRKAAAAYRKGIIYGLSQKTGLSIDKVEKDLVYGKNKVLERPHDYGWVIEGHKASFGNEDPYILFTAAAQSLYENNPEYRFANAEDYDRFLDEIFDASAGAMGSFVSRGAKRQLEKLMGKFDVVIVSNGRNTRIEKALNDAGLTDVKVIGSAKKMIVDPNFDKVDRYLDVNGLNVELRRPRYYEVLNSIEGKKTVVGDVFSLDLALPYYLGMGIALKENSYTPKWSKEFVESKGKVIKNLDELLEII